MLDTINTKDVPSYFELKLSLCSDKARFGTIGDQTVASRMWKQFSLVQASSLFWYPQSVLSAQLVLEAFSQELEWPKLEANHSSAFTAKANVLSSTSTPKYGLINHKHNFPFTFSNLGYDSVQLTILP